MIARYVSVVTQALQSLHPDNGARILVDSNAASIAENEATMICHLFHVIIITVQSKSSSITVIADP